MDFQLGGLPLHPLLVHLVVVGVPVSAVAAVLHVCWPTARRRLGIVTVLIAAAMAALVPVTASAGSALAASMGGGGPAVGVHAARAATLIPLVNVLFVVVLADYLWFRFVGDVKREAPSPKVRTIVHVLAIVVTVAIAVATLVSVVLVGDAGARAVWGGRG